MVLLIYSSPKVGSSTDVKHFSGKNMHGYIWKFWPPFSTKGDNWPPKCNSEPGMVEEACDRSILDAEEGESLRVST